MDLEAATELVRAKVRQMPARGTVTLPLPVGDGRWGARFGVLDPEKRDAMHARARAAVTPDEEARAMAGFVADSCRSIVVRVEEDGETSWEDVTAQGQPVVFGKPFAKALGYAGDDLDSMEDVVLLCWTTDDGTLNMEALGNFSDLLMAWAQDTNRRVAGEVLGESRAGRPSEAPAAQSPTD